MNRVEIKTADGICPAFEWGNDARPSVLVFMDGVGMREAMHVIAERIASSGFHVLLPDLFYRLGPYTAPNAKTVFADPEQRAAWMGKVAPIVTPALVERDLRAFLEYLPGKVGITGYCMGARLALYAAGFAPDRIAAVGAFHPGRPVTDGADSAHHVVTRSKATRIVVAGAMEDASFSEADQKTLARALESAGIPHVVETWPARHGWVPNDTAVYDPVQADRHYDTLTELFRATLS